jgi:hypothetical protein
MKRPQSRTLRRYAFACTLAVVAAVLLAPPAVATEPSQAAGGIILTGFSQTITKTAGGNVFFSEVNTGIFTGTFSGTFTAQLERVAHPSGIATFHGIVTFAGTVAGRAGTARFLTEGTGSTTLPTFESRIQTLPGGTGQLSDLHALASLSVFVPFGTYSGTYHFDDS